MAQLIPLWPFIAILGGDFVVIASTRKPVAHVVEAVETPAIDLLILRLLLQRVEREGFNARD